MTTHTLAQRPIAPTPTPPATPGERNGHAAAPEVASDHPTLLRRHPANPILTPRDLGQDFSCVFNSGVVRHREQFVMLVNAWDPQWRPRFMIATSDDGVTFDVDPTNRFSPPREYPYVPHEGIFDTRITPFDDHYLITYNVASRLGSRIRLARTHDFNSFEDLGFITAPDHRNCVIFPERIDDDFLRLERPNVDDAGDIYLSRSPDLVHWGQTQLVLERNHRYWESAKIGPGAPPIRTDAGWLAIYHGARKGMNGYSYQAGAMLLDLADPATIVGKLDRCLLEPREPYERCGAVPNVVFPTGVVQAGDDELFIYYGAADTAMALATASKAALIDACLD